MVFLGVNVPWDKEQMARLFVETYKIPYLEGRDAAGKVTDLYGIDATPTTFFIDRSGKVVNRVEGELDSGELAKQLEALLAAK